MCIFICSRCEGHWKRIGRYRGCYTHGLPSDVFSNHRRLTEVGGDQYEGAWDLPSPDWAKDKAGGGSRWEEFHLLKASSGVGGSEPASEPGGNPMSKKKTEENEISNPLRSDFCSFNERFGVSRKENNDSFFKQLMWRPRGIGWTGRWEGGSRWEYM